MNFFLIWEIVVYGIYFRRRDRPQERICLQLTNVPYRATYDNVKT